MCPSWWKDRQLVNKSNSSPADPAQHAASMILHHRCPLLSRHTCLYSDPKTQPDTHMENVDPDPMECKTNYE